MRQFYYLCLYNPIAANMTHMITYPSGRCTEGALCARRGDTPTPYKSFVYSTLRKDPPQPLPLWRGFTASRKDYHKALSLFKGDERREALSERSGGVSHVGAGHLMQKTQKFLRRGVLSHTDCTDFTDWRVASLALSALPSACVPEAHARESMRVSVQSVRSA